MFNGCPKLKQQAKQHYAKYTQGLSRAARTRLMQQYKPHINRSWEEFKKHLPDVAGQHLIFSWLGIDKLDDKGKQAFWESTDADTRAIMLCKKHTTYLQHQQFVVQYITTHPDTRYGLLYHEMGTGKTCTATALMGAFATNPLIKFVYVVVPNTTLVKQFATDFAINCSFVPKHETTKMTYEKDTKKQKYIFTYNDTHFYVMSIDTYRSEDIKRPQESVLVLDESHSTRTSTEITQVGTAIARKKQDKQTQEQDKQTQIVQIFSERGMTKMLLKHHNFKQVFFLTGTPVLNTATDFVTLLNNMVYLTGQQQMLNAVDDKFLMNILNEKEHFITNNLTQLKDRIKYLLNKTHGFVSRVRVSNMPVNNMPAVDFTQHYYNYSSDFVRDVNTNYTNMIDYIQNKYNNGVRSAAPIQVPMSLQDYNAVIEKISKAQPSEFDNITLKKISWDTKTIHHARVLCNSVQKPSS